VSDSVFEPETLQAIGELLAAGEQHGIGVTFEPDAEGWHVGYLVGTGGGGLVAGYELGDTARAALRPLEELAAERAQARRDRG
jgi:hypothetical protein